MPEQELNELHDEMVAAGLPIESLSDGPKVTQVRFKEDEDLTPEQRAEALRRLADWYDPPAE